jgi:hypothetical protein
MVHLMTVVDRMAGAWAAGADVTIQQRAGPAYGIVDVGIAQPRFDG